MPTPGTTAGSSASAASHAARGAVTVGFVSTLSGMAMLIIAGLCVVLRRASNNGGGEGSHFIVGTEGGERAERREGVCLFVLSIGESVCRSVGRYWYE